MNKHIREVLVRVQVKDQVWYEVISIEQYYGELQASSVRCHLGQTRRPMASESYRSVFRHTVQHGDNY